MAVDPRTILRIETEAGVEDLTDRLAERLTASDLGTLFLEVFRRRALAVTPARLMTAYARNRFAGASPLSAGDLFAMTAAAHKVLTPRFALVELSPLVPLGTCSATADVDPAWSIAALRGTEVVSDVTNALALEAALHRRRGQPEVHLAAVQRVVRPQAYRNPAALAHFSLMGLISTGRDRGDFRFETEATERHLRAHLDLLSRSLPPNWRPRISYTCPPRDQRLTALASTAGALGVELVENPDREAARGYYSGFCLNIEVVRPAGAKHQISDLGTVDWTARLLGDAKERTVVSGAGLDRLVELRHEASNEAEVAE